MSQAVFATIDPSISGDTLATTLNSFKDALVSGMSGTSRPANLQAGGAWVDTTNDPTSWTYKVYTGSADISVFTLNLTSGIASVGQSLDSFSVKRISADTTGAILQLIKNRIATNGQVLNGDVVGEIRITGRTDTSTNPVVAKIIFTASDDMTTSASGGTLSFYSTAAGTASLVEHLRFVNGQVEAVLPLKVNALVLVGQNVSTAATISQLDASKVLVEMTGSTGTSIEGVNSSGSTKTIVIHNRSTANVTLSHLDAGAASADQIKLPGGVPYVLEPDSTATLYYSVADSKWKLVSDFASSGSFKRQSFFGVTQSFTVPSNISVLTLIAYRKQNGLAKNKSVMIDSYGNAYAWGENASGELGLGDVVARSSPVAVLGGLSFLRILGFGPGGGTQTSTVALASNGSLYAWGLNANGQLGVGDVTPRSSPVAVLGGLKFLSASAIENGAIGLTTGGAAYAWGKNANGELGVGDVTPRSSPVAVLGGLKFAKIFVGETAQAGQVSYVGLTKTGAAYAWGANGNGQLGVGDVTPRSSPVAVVGGISFSQITPVGESGASFIGIDLNGNAYGWGANNAGQLGVGDVTPRSSPVAVLGGLKFSRIFSDASFSGASVYGLTSDGTLYAWGNNVWGQLGVGDSVYRSSPVAVLGGHSFQKVLAYQTSVAAITPDGDMYAWGLNTAGELGLGDTTNRSSPVAVLGGLKFVDIVYAGSPIDSATVIGITRDGLAYAWGNNSKGTLGDGTSIDKSSPVLVVGSFSPDAREAVTNIDLTVTPGQTYTIGMGDGGAYFGSTPLGRDIYRIDIEYFS